MRKPALFVILMSTLLLASSCASTGKGGRLQEAEAHYKLGVAHLSENRVQQAFVEFHKAYELNPNNKEVLNGIGLIHLLHFDEAAKAREYFERAVRIDPDFAEAYNNLGYSHEKAGSYDAAVNYYKKAVSFLTYQTPQKAYLNMGNSYYRMGRHEQALNAYKEAIKREPTLSIAYMRMALCYNAMGRYGEASAAMTQAILLDPVYKGNRERAQEDLGLRKLRAKGAEEQDFRDWGEILKY